MRILHENQVYMQSKTQQRNKPPLSESWPDRPFEIVHFDHFSSTSPQCLVVKLILISSMDILAGKILLVIILKARYQQYLINIKQLSIRIAGKVRAIISKLKEFALTMPANLQAVKCNYGFQIIRSFMN